MPSASFAAGCLPPSLFPPQTIKAFHDALLDEMLAERVASSRNRRTPRGVKRKMSKFPPRRAPTRPSPQSTPRRRTVVK